MASALADKLPVAPFINGLIGEVARKWGFSKHPKYGSPKVPPSKWSAGAHRVRVLSTDWFYD